MDDLLRGHGRAARAAAVGPERAARSKTRRRSPTTAGSGPALPVLCALPDRGARSWSARTSAVPRVRRARSTRCAPVADRLAALLGSPVEFALDTVGESARLLPPTRRRQLLLLENVRFNPGETCKDDAERAAFARALAQLRRRRRRRYVDDAFGAVHRAHASVYDVARLLPHYQGALVARAAGAAPADRRPGTALRGGARRLQGLGQAGRDPAAAQGRPPAGRRRDVLHVPQGRRATRWATRCWRPTRSTPAGSCWPRPATGSCCPPTSWSGRHLRRRRHPDGAGRRDPGRPEGPGHRARLGGHVHRGSTGRRHGVLERADGGVRGAAVRGRHPGRGRGGGRLWWVHRGRRRGLGRGGPGAGHRRPRSATSRPAAARRWNTWRARPCPVSPYWRTS